MQKELNKIVKDTNKFLKKFMPEPDFLSPPAQTPSQDPEKP